MLTKITNKDRTGKGVTGLPDTPELTTMQMQERFDSLGNLAIDGLNTVVDELSSVDSKNSGAENIGANVPQGIAASQTVQSIINALAAGIVVAREKAHTHENKAALDAITINTKSGYDRVVSLLSGVLSIEQTATDSRAAIPSSAAVHDLLNTFDYAELKLALYPIGSVYFSHINNSPENFIGGVWQRETLVDDVFSWRRTA